MNEEANLIIDTTKESMDAAIDHFEKELIKIRAGKASPVMLQGVMVDYYGSETPLSQVANISTPDAMTISVQPWEKQMIPEIEKAIMYANLGLNPSNNGESVIISVPPVTEERRKELVKTAKSEAEKARVSIRSSRKDANNELKKIDDLSEDMTKNYEDDVQSLTDKYIAKIDAILEKKRKGYHDRLGFLK